MDWPLGDSGRSPQPVMSPPPAFENFVWRPPSPMSSQLWQEIAAQAGRSRSNEPPDGSAPGPPILGAHESELFSSFLDSFSVNPGQISSISPELFNLGSPPPLPPPPFLRTPPPLSAFDDGDLGAPPKRRRLSASESSVSAAAPSTITSAPRSRARTSRRAASDDDDDDAFYDDDDEEDVKPVIRGKAGGRGRGRAKATGTRREGRTPLTDGQKRSNHIVSEQRRREAIRTDFKDLVGLLQAADANSGVTLDDPTKVGKRGGRGRGRRADAGANASKAIVLQQASRYISWLDRGNDALEAEVLRVEAAARG